MSILSSRIAFKDSLLELIPFRLSKANLKSLSFDLAFIGDFEQEAIDNIRSAVEKSMPIIEIVNLRVITTNHEKDGPLAQSLAKILIEINYNVPRLKVVERKLQAVIYAGG